MVQAITVSRGTKTTGFRVRVFKEFAKLEPRRCVQPRAAAVRTGGVVHT